MIGFVVAGLLAAASASDERAEAPAAGYLGRHGDWVTACTAEDEPGGGWCNVAVHAEPGGESAPSLSLFVTAGRLCLLVYSAGPFIDPGGDMQIRVAGQAVLSAAAADAETRQFAGPLVDLCGAGPSRLAEAFAAAGAGTALVRWPVEGGGVTEFHFPLSGFAAGFADLQGHSRAAQSAPTQPAPTQPAPDPVGPNQGGPNQGGASQSAPR